MRLPSLRPTLCVFLIIQAVVLALSFVAEGMARTGLVFAAAILFTAETIYALALALKDRWRESLFVNAVTIVMLGVYAFSGDMAVSLLSTAYEWQTTQPPWFNTEAPNIPSPQYSDENPERWRG